MAEYFDEFVDIKGKYIRKPVEQTTKVTKIKVNKNNNTFYGKIFFKL